MSAIRRSPFRRDATSESTPAARLVLALGAAVLVLTVLAVLLDRTPTAVGTNGIRPIAFPATLPGGAAVCDGVAYSRPGIDAVTMAIRSGGGPPGPLAVELPGGPRGSVVRATDGAVTLPLAPGSTLDGGMLCLRNLGGEPVRVAGERVGGATLEGRPQDYRVAIGYVDRSPPRRAAAAPEILRDVGNGRGSAAGPATGWAAAVLALAAFAASLAGAWRLLR